MKLHRFFISETLQPKSQVTISNSELAHQLKNVFRMGIGDMVILLDNTGFEFTAEIKILEKNTLTFLTKGDKKSANVPHREIWLFPAMIKKGKLEWVIEKGTELGITGFAPVISERSEKKNINVERLHKILQEAAEQSERGTLPKLEPPLPLAKALTFAQEHDIPLIALHPQGQLFHPIRESAALGILVGPEGGWSETEIQLFQSYKIPLYSLGQQVLRAETASIVISSLLLVF